jgi:hypothetical protein
MSRLFPRTQRRGRSGAHPVRRALLLAGAVAAHAVLVPYHLATEVHLHGGAGLAPSRRDASLEHERFHLCARYHGPGGGGHHKPHAAADHGREAPRPESCGGSAAPAPDLVAPAAVAMPQAAVEASPARPPPILEPPGTQPGPRRIRGPPPA